MAAHQVPPSLGFSRQEHWSGLPFPSPMHESENEVTQLCPTLSDLMDCSLRGSSIHGIFQTRVLEWVAIAFSVKSLSCIQLFATLGMRLLCPWDSPGKNTRVGCLITTNWKILKEMRIPDHLTCFLKNLYAGQETTEPDMEQQTGSELGKEYVKAVYCHPAYLTYMQSTSCEMLGWMNHSWKQDWGKKYQ